MSKEVEDFYSKKSKRKLRFELKVVILGIVVAILAFFFFIFLEILGVSTFLHFFPEKEK